MNAAVRIVAVTGANGFIGARAAAMLAAAHPGTAVRILARRADRAGNHIVIDLRDPAAVRSALEGCAAVIHCAFDFQNMAANVPIATNLARACADAGARLIHLSTAAVHEPFPDGPLDETTPAGPGGSDYKRVKLALETSLLREVEESGLDLVILRPTVVYGPLGRAWTDSPVRELLTGTVVLPDNGLGLCNAVYLDDVCQAIIAALTAPVPSGERFLVSGPVPVAWKDFYGAYQDILGMRAIRLEPPGGAEPPEYTENDRPESVTLYTVRLKGLITRILGGRTAERLRLSVTFPRSLILGARLHVPTGARRDLFRSRCRIRTEKAARLLGYEPRYDLETGMRMTAPYIEHTYGRMARLCVLRSKGPFGTSRPR